MSLTLNTGIKTVTKRQVRRYDFRALRVQTSWPRCIVKIELQVFTTKKTGQHNHSTLGRAHLTCDRTGQRRRPCNSSFGYPETTGPSLAQRLWAQPFANPSEKVACAALHLSDAGQHQHASAQPVKTCVPSRPVTGSRATPCDGFVIKTGEQLFEKKVCRDSKHLDGYNDLGPSQILIDLNQGGRRCSVFNIAAP